MMTLLERLIYAFEWFMVFRAFILIIDYSRGYDIEIPYSTTSVLEDEKEREE